MREQNRRQNSKKRVFINDKKIGKKEKKHRKKQIKN